MTAEASRSASAQSRFGLEARSIIYYAVMVLILAALILKQQGHVLPGGLATQVGHNSESFLFAILVALEIQVVRPRLMESRWRWPVAITIGVVLCLLGYLLLQMDGWPSTVVTLNEPLVGAGLLMVYITFRRPFRYWLLVFVLVAAFIVVLFNTALVRGQAESLVPLLLAPLALDVFDRSILEPSVPARHGRRVLWMAVLLALAIVFSVASAAIGTDPHGWWQRGVDYAQRAAESYWGWLMLHLYFGYWLGRLWRGRHVIGAKG